MSVNQVGRPTVVDDDPLYRHTNPGQDRDSRIIAMETPTGQGERGTQ